MLCVSSLADAGWVHWPRKYVQQEEKCLHYGAHLRISLHTFYDSFFTLLSAATRYIEEKTKRKTSPTLALISYTSCHPLC